MQPSKGKTLSDMLPRGAKTRVANKHRVPGGYVNKVIAGDVKNDGVYASLLAEAAAEQAREREFDKVLSSLQKVTQ